MKTFFKLVNRGMARFETAVSAVLFTLVFLLFVGQVVCRYCFTPIVWAQEVILALFLWTTIFASCAAERTDANIKFDSVYNGGSDVRKAVLDIISSCLVIPAFGILLISSVEYIDFMFDIKAGSLPLSKGVVFLPILYMLFSFVMQYIKKLYTAIIVLKAKFRKES